MRNKYPGNCLVCGKHVAAGAGYFQRVGWAWKVRCVDCVGKGNEPVDLNLLPKKEHKKWKKKHD